MNRRSIRPHDLEKTLYIIDDVQEPQPEPEVLEKDNDNMYTIVGTIDGYYIVQTPKGLKKAKIDVQNKKNINDEIENEII